MTLVVDIAVEGDGWPDELEESFARAIRLSADMSGMALAPAAEVSLLLSDDRTVRELNRRWRNNDKPTNVLSFPAAEPAALAHAPLLGDIVLAYETTSREAAAQQKSLADHAVHLVVHGFLHLLGYDHVSTAQAEAMEALETRILARLGIADPYADGLSLDEVEA
jgi:probable rRNA maturation factor